MILKLGSKGEEVKVLQAKLIELGYFVGKGGFDGYFGAFTENAVKSFQKSNRLDVDGKVGDKTMTMLNRAVGAKNFKEMSVIENKPMAPSGKFKLSETSIKRLNNVHPDLIKIVHRAIEITSQDFMVLEGARTLAQQKEYFRTGKSKTMKSRHLPSSNYCGMSCAVDLVPIVGGKVSWDWQYYYPLAEAVKQAAKDINIPIEWGGDWKTFKDGPHFQLPWAVYK